MDTRITKSTTNYILDMFLSESESSYAGSSTVFQLYPDEYPSFIYSAVYDMLDIRENISTMIILFFRLFLGMSILLLIMLLCLTKQKNTPEK
jgi:hypothetical protein